MVLKIIQFLPLGLIGPLSSLYVLGACIRKLVLVQNTYFPKPQPKLSESYCMGSEKSTFKTSARGAFVRH